MRICHCNPFGSDDVKKCLEDKKGESVRVSQVYKSCSGGQSPNCGTCMAHLRPMIMEHNREATVEQLRRSLEREQAPASKKSVGAP